MLELNHNPFVSVWVDYNGTHFFSKYDVRLNDGTLVVATGGPDGFSGINRSNIDRIKLILNRDTTPDRIAENAIEQFGTNFPIFINSRQAFLYKKNLKPGEYIEPVDMVAYRPRGRYFGEFGRTSVMIATGDIVTEPSKVGRGLRYMDKLWTDKSTSLMMPDDVRQRFPFLTAMSDKDYKTAYAKHLITLIWPTYPVEYLDECAQSLVAFPDVEISDDRINKTTTALVGILNEIVDSKLRWLNYRLMGEPENQTLLDQEQKLKEMRR